MLGASNPNSVDVGSFNINFDALKNDRHMLKLASDGSYESMLSGFSQKGSHSILFQNKSGSLESKINGFIGEKGSFANPNIGRSKPDNQK